LALRYRLVRMSEKGRRAGMMFTAVAEAVGLTRESGRSRSVISISAPRSTARRCSESRFLNSANLTRYKATCGHIRSCG
jgi:hypothetical protein